MGHYSNECPYIDNKVEKNNGAVNLLMRAITLTQNDPTLNGDIDPSWILLDTCSTASVAGNKELVTDIKPCDVDDELVLATNGGGMTYNHIASLKLFPVRVHYNPDSIATILALKDVASIPGCYITMDTRVAREMRVTFEDGKTYLFKECGDGLYFYNTADNAGVDEDNSINPTVNSYSFLQTVASNENLYSKADITKAQEARAL